MGLIGTTIEMYKEHGAKFVYAGIMYKFFRKGNIEYKLNYKGLKIYGNNRTATWATYNEVMKTGAYDFPVKEAKTIIDLGANVGLTSLWFYKKYPKAQIIAVEPAKENLEYLHKNIESNRIKNVFIEEKPVWNKITKLGFSPGECSPSDYFGETKNDLNYLSTTMPNIIKKFDIEHIDILKCDIEGGEIPILTSNNEWLSKVDNIFIEIHSMVHAGLGSVQHAPIIFKEMKNKGFEFKQMKEGLYWFTKKSNLLKKGEL